MENAESSWMSSLHRRENTEGQMRSEGDVLPAFTIGHDLGLQNGGERLKLS